MRKTKNSVTDSPTASAWFFFGVFSGISEALPLELASPTHELSVDPRGCRETFQRLANINGGDVHTLCHGVHDWCPGSPSSSPSKDNETECINGRQKSRDNEPNTHMSLMAPMGVLEMRKAETKVNLARTYKLPVRVRTVDESKGIISG